MLKISHLPRIMIRMKRKGKAAVGGRVYQRSVCRYHEARYLTRPDIRDDASIVPYKSGFVCCGFVMRSAAKFLCGGVRAPRPTGNGMVTVGADARIGPHRFRRRKAHRL